MFLWSKKVAKIGSKIEYVQWSKKEKFAFCTGISTNTVLVCTGTKTERKNGLFRFCTQRKIEDLISLFFLMEQKRRIFSLKRSGPKYIL